MKLILILIINYFHLVKIINCKKYKGFVGDEILKYDLDPSVTPYTEVFSVDNILLEQLDDDLIEIGGYAECLKSFDRNFPIHLVIHTKTLEQSVWKEQAMKLSLLDACKEFLNPDRFWFSFTRLWDSDVCPPQKGFKFHIPTQNTTGILDLPDNLPIAPWRAFIMISQVSPLSKIEFGFGLNLEMIPR